MNALPAVPEFGRNCMFFMCSFTGQLEPQICLSLVQEIIEAAGMKPSHDPVTFNYEGDLGYIVAAPLIESMVFVDYWVRHEGGYLTLDSCCPFYPHKIVEVMEKAGLKVCKQQVTGLSLP